MSEFVKLEKKNNIIETLNLLGQAIKENKKVIYIVPSINYGILYDIYSKLGIDKNNYRLIDVSGKQADAYKIDLAAGTEDQIIDRLDKMFQIYRQNGNINYKDVSFEVLSYSVRVLKRVYGDISLKRLNMFVCNSSNCMANILKQFTSLSFYPEDDTMKNYLWGYEGNAGKIKDQTLDFRSFLIKLAQYFPSKPDKPMTLDNKFYGEIITYPMTTQLDIKSLYLSSLETMITDFLNSKEAYDYEGIEVYYLDTMNYEFAHLNGIKDYINPNAEYFRTVYKVEEPAIIIDDEDEDDDLFCDVEFDKC